MGDIKTISSKGQMQEIIDSDIEPRTTTHKDKEKEEHCTGDSLTLIKHQFW